MILTDLKLAFMVTKTEYEFLLANIINAVNACYNGLSQGHRNDP